MQFGILDKKEQIKTDFLLNKKDLIIDLWIKQDKDLIILNIVNIELIRFLSNNSLGLINKRLNKVYCIKNVC